MFTAQIGTSIVIKETIISTKYLLHIWSDERIEGGKNCKNKIRNLNVFFSCATAQDNRSFPGFLELKLVPPFKNFYSVNSWPGKTWGNAFTEKRWQDTRGHGLPDSTRIFRKVECGHWLLLGTRGPKTAYRWTFRPQSSHLLTQRSGKKIGNELKNRYVAWLTTKETTQKRRTQQKRVTSAMKINQTNNSRSGNNI